MPTVTLHVSTIEKLLGKKIPLEELKDRISMLGTDLEKIEGDEIHVEIFPNRPDLLSEQGLGRALQSFLNIKTGLRHYHTHKSDYKVIVDHSVIMRPYTACAVVKNLTFNDERIRELMQIQEKLATTHGRNRKKSAYGIYPLEPINFPVHYIAKDPATVKFKPLGFTNTVTASEVPELHPKGKAYAHLTAGWKKYPFFIDNKDNVMCMLPFTNSEETGKVTTQTKNVFIECSGIDLDNVTKALNIITTMLADMGGEIHCVEIVYPDKTVKTPDFTPAKMTLEPSYVNNILGLHLTAAEVQHYLARMGFGTEGKTALIPAYRTDIIHPIDLVEDIAIAYGYENIQGEIPNVATIGGEEPLEKIKSKIRDILIGLGLLEVKNVHLIAEEDSIKTMSHEKGISLKNAISEYNVLRPSMLPSLLKTTSQNQHHEYPQNIFELGRTFHPNKNKETSIEEIDQLGVMLCHETTDFTHIRQICDALFASMGLPFTVKEVEHSSFISGRAGEIILNKKKIGLLGEINPQVLTHWQLSMPVTFFEIDLAAIVELIKK